MYNTTSMSSAWPPLYVCMYVCITMCTHYVCIHYVYIYVRVFVTQGDTNTIRETGVWPRNLTHACNLHVFHYSFIVGVICRTSVLNFKLRCHEVTIGT